jgi:hypothetical protein
MTDLHVAHPVLTLDLASMLMFRFRATTVVAISGGNGKSALGTNYLSEAKGL